MIRGGHRRAKERGKRFEWQTRRRLRDDGYHVIVSAGSMTATDMVAVKPGEILFVQCKAGVAEGGSPGLISPDERVELLALAMKTAPLGRAVVAHQIRVGRRHELAFRELIGPDPGQSRDWTPDQVGEA